MDAPVPRQSLDLHPGTLPFEKVMTQLRIGIGYSDEEWHPVLRRCCQALHQDPEFFDESFGAKPSGTVSKASRFAYWNL
jgi:hypothetical protein